MTTTCDEIMYCFIMVAFIVWTRAFSLHFQRPSHFQEGLCGNSVCGTWFCAISSLWQSQVFASFPSVCGHVGKHRKSTKSDLLYPGQAVALFCIFCFGSSIFFSQQDQPRLNKSLVNNIHLTSKFGLFRPCHCIQMPGHPYPHQLVLKKASPLIVQMNSPQD